MEGLSTYKSNFRHFVEYTDSDGKLWEGEIVLGSGRRGSHAYMYVSDVLWETEGYPIFWEDVETELDKEFDKYITNAKTI